MALTPTGPRPSGVPNRQTVTRAPRQQPPRAQAPQAEQTRPTPGRRLRVAISDAEIDAQIKRLVSLIANDNIDPNAPPGSYINMLL